MLLLKAILVVFIAEIESGSTSSAKGNEEAKTQLPPDSYINVTDENGCWYLQIVDIEGGSFMGSLELLDGATVNVTVGSCALGCCGPASPPQHRIIPLMSAAEDEEENKSKDKKNKIKNKKNKKNNKKHNKSKNKDKNKARGISSRVK
uniref:Putative secreted protein n=1 Tax=Ixodes ricinus TaxID=34613 RepID=A0A090X9G7_IXORI